MANSLVTVTETVAEAARALSGADGATFVLRDGDKCYYVDENAIAPLWKGRRFPAESCISGWSMIHREVVVIRDIYVDARIPHDAYRPTFVKSLCMVPIRAENPIGAIGNYWAAEHWPTDEEIKLLQVLANSSAVALENLELKAAIRRRSEEVDDLADRKRELEAVIHSLAHDLRSPVSTMMGFAELVWLRKATNLDESAKEYLRAIIDTGSRTCQQIERMLTLYRATSRPLDRQMVDLTAMGAEIAEHLRTQESARRIEMVIEPGLSAFADPWLLRVVLENLLSNAFKYSSKKPDARVRMGAAARGEREVTFFVADNGAGFNPSDAHRLFRPLVRLHADSEFSGTGLGLASVARIVELHGGRVRAEGRPSEGATFYFSLPTAP